MTKIVENVSYDRDANASYITINNKQVVDTLATDQQDCWVDVDCDGKTVGYEILNANQHFTLINTILLSQKPLAECVSY